MSVRSLREIKRGDPLPPNSIRIDRGTMWGNPFVMKDKASAGEREAVIGSYKQWLWRQIRANRFSMAELASLHGKDLWCWCAPLRCHGDILESAAEWAFIQIEQQKTLARAMTMADQGADRVEATDNSTNSNGAEAGDEAAKGGV